MLTVPSEPGEGASVLVWARQVTRLLRQLIPRESGDIWPDSNAGGTRYRLRGRRAGKGGGGAVHPFQVLAAGQTESEAPQPQVQVQIDSWLSGSVRPGSKLTITGLGDPFIIAEGEAIWLEITFVDLAFSTATIEHGDLWEGYDSPVHYLPHDPGAEKVQDKWRELIAFTEAVPVGTDDHPGALTLTEGESSFRVIQRVRSNLRLCEVCFEGVNVIGCVPYHAPGPAVPAP